MIGADSQGATGAAADAAALGVTVLASVLAGARDGITVVDADRRFVYANPSACGMLGRPLAQLHGRDLMATIPIPARDREFALARFAERRSRGVGESGDPFTATLCREDGTEREVVCSTFPIEISGIQHGVSVFRDVSTMRAASRTATALGQTTAQLVGSGTADEILCEIARHAVEGTQALACGIDVVGNDHQVESAGGYGFPFYLSQEGRSGVSSRAARGGGSVDVSDFTAGAINVGDHPRGPIVVADARSAWEANPVTRHFAATVQSLDWRGAVYLPLSWEDRVFGFFCIYLPAGIAGPTETELAFYTVLADQAAVAVTNERLSSQAAHAAALLERRRLARELHDSVSQALFSMTMQSRAAELAMTAARCEPSGPLARAISEVGQLIRGATAEMRALIFELRPGALAEEGLVAAIRTQADALSAREQVRITVDGPDERLEIDAGVEEHVYRIASEALHNVVKHGRATAAAVTIAERPDELRMIVTDDGVGFDPTVEHAGHLGLSTMSQRAALIAGELRIVSAPDEGTTVRLTVPLRGARLSPPGPQRPARSGDVVEGEAAPAPDTARIWAHGDRGDTDHRDARATGTESTGATDLAAAAALGDQVLAAIVAGAREGISVIDQKRRYVYANPAACRILGCSPHELRGQDLLERVPQREHSIVIGHLAEQLVGAPTVFANTVVDPAGVEREIVSSMFAISIDGTTLAVSVFQDVTETRTAGRAAVALAQAAAQVVGADATPEILSGLARHAVEGTRALAAEISAAGTRDGPAEAGAYGIWSSLPADTETPGASAVVDTPIAAAIEALSAGAILVGASAGKPIVVTDARIGWRRYPCLASTLAVAERHNAWQGAAVLVPLAWQDRVFGLFIAYLPAGVAGPSEDELAFYTSMTDQAAVAVMNARLTSEAREAATLLERTRLARELHDSVSQALFSMTMQVRAAQLSLAASGADPGGPLSTSIGELATLSHSAMAEMRALIFELRPGALAEEGLVRAVRVLGAALTAREHLVVAVDGPDDCPELDAAAEERLYRIVSNTLRNLVRAGRATRATVTISCEDRTLRPQIADDDSGAGATVDVSVPHVPVTEHARSTDGG